MNTSAAPPPGGSILVLSDDVIDRIAAGEVVERPASVVKELVENAIDAGAEAVQVHLEKGGLDRIVVSDDGCGMSALDASRAPLRHATSKLHSADDLAHIATFGFRGEALSSIAAVSEFVLTTRRREDAVGSRVRLVGGALTCIEEVGVPVGTTVDVKGLFYNTPARRKFMRSAATEQAHACEAALRVVLGARRGSLLVEASSRRLIDIPPHVDAATRSHVALGPRAGVTYAFDDEQEGVRVSGCVTRPDFHRADTKSLFFFVNGRFVRDRMLQRATLDGYRTVLEPGRLPAAIVYVDVASNIVDVNVHPQKLEVRFSDSELIFRRVSRTVASVLARTPWLRAGGLRGPLTARERPYAWQQQQPRGGRDYAALVREAGQIASFGFADRHATSPAPDATGLTEHGASSEAQPRTPGTLPALDHPGFFGNLRVIGQVLGTYLVCEGTGEVVLIDQHAAHERVTFFGLCKDFDRGEIPRQALLLPEPIELSARQSGVLSETWPHLSACGVEIEPVGPNRFVVRAVPARLSHANAQRLAMDLVDEVCALEDAGLGVVARAAQVRLLSRCACHASVRAGDALTHTEVSALLRALDEADFAGSCPHGRPVCHRLSQSEIERLFGRR